MRKTLSGTSAGTVDVFVVESSPLNCQLVERALRAKRNHIQVAGSAVSAEDAMTGLRQLQPHVAVVSAQMHGAGLGGYRILQDMRLGTPRTKGVMLLQSRDHDLVVDAFRCGARGVVFRDEPLETLCKCIHAVHSGQVWANSETMRHLVDALGKTMPPHPRDARRIELLSKREADVARLVADGMNNKEISGELAIAEHTVRNYLFHIFDKLGVSTRVEVVLYWMHQRSNGSPELALRADKAAQPG
jgi:DNA-binding NarL/FixJ family response regulator